jgi:hypothetical protein
MDTPADMSVDTAPPLVDAVSMDGTKTLDQDPLPKSTVPLLADPLPSRPVPNVPDATLEASKAGISLLTRERKEGAADDPLEGPEKTVFADCAVRPRVSVPEVVTGEPVIVKIAGPARATLVTVATDPTICHTAAPVEGSMHTYSAKVDSLIHRDPLR